MDWKEEIIKFCVCTIVILLSLWSLDHTISKYYVPNEYITGGIVTNKIHYEARVDTTYYPDENDNTVTVDRIEYDSCEIVEYYSRK